MGVSVVVVKVAASFGKTPVVATIVVSKVTVAVPEFSTFGKITAVHVRSIPHAMRSISTPAHRMRFTTASHMCATTAASNTASTSAPSASAASPSASAASTFTTLGYQGHSVLVTCKRWKAR
jgi:hypothetical protein